MSIGLTTFPGEVLEGKKVIVIGPAESVEQHFKTLESFDFDLVVRLNRGPALAAGLKGVENERTDIWFHCLNEEPTTGGGPISERVIHDQCIKWIVYPLHEDVLYPIELDTLTRHKKIKFFGTSPESYLELKQYYPGRWPTTGLATLVYLMSLDFRLLHITGFTFLTTPYVPSYRPEISTLKEILDITVKAGNHAIHAEPHIFKIFFNKAVSNGKRVILDDSLMNTIRNI